MAGSDPDASIGCGGAGRLRRPAGSSVSSSAGRPGSRARVDRAGGAGRTGGLRLPDGARHVQTRDRGGSAAVAGRVPVVARSIRARSPSRRGSTSRPGTPTQRRSTDDGCGVLPHDVPLRLLLPQPHRGGRCRAEGVASPSERGERGLGLSGSGRTGGPPLRARGRPATARAPSIGTSWWVTDAGTPRGISVLPQPRLAAEMARQGFLAPPDDALEDWVRETYAAGEG